jgi:hypothetical protein
MTLEDGSCRSGAATPASSLAGGSKCQRSTPAPPRQSCTHWPKMSPPMTTASPQQRCLKAGPDRSPPDATPLEGVPSAPPTRGTSSHQIADDQHPVATCSGPSSPSLARSDTDMASTARNSADLAARRCSGRRAARAATTAADTAEEARGRRPGALAPPPAARCLGRHAAPAGDPRAQERSSRRRRLPRRLCPTAAPRGGEGREGGRGAVGALGSPISPPWERRGPPSYQACKNSSIRASPAVGAPHGQIRR